MPGIRAALGLDTAAVQAAYQRLYGEPLAAIYTRKVVFGERLRWMTSTRRPPVGGAAAVLGRPGLNPARRPRSAGAAHRVAGIGAVPGIVLLIIFGLLNAITAAALAESVARAARPVLAWGTSANSCPNIWATPAQSC